MNWQHSKHSSNHNDIKWQSKIRKKQIISSGLHLYLNGKMQSPVSMLIYGLDPVGQGSAMQVELWFMKLWVMKGGILDNSSPSLQPPVLCCTVSWMLNWPPVPALWALQGWLHQRSIATGSTSIIQTQHLFSSRYFIFFIQINTCWGNCIKLLSFC